MITASSILQTAVAEIGYSRWTDPQPGTKYGRDYAARHGKYYGSNGVPYCGLFVTWVFRRCGEQPPGGDFAYCPAGIKAMKKLGLEVNKFNAQPGDIVFFDWDGGESDHVGFVESKNGNYLLTIEGNTTANGVSGVVARRKRTLSCVCNVFRPRYETAATHRTNKTVLEIDGWFGQASIRRLQAVLNTTQDGVISGQPVCNRRYCPNSSTGWEWGARGAKGSMCIRAWQRKTGATVDGLYGHASVKSTQKFLGVPVDGYMGAVTVKAWQTWLNNH